MTRYGDEECSNRGEMDVPDIYGALRGLRSFKVDPESHHLMGPYFPVWWRDAVMEAECLQSEPPGHRVWGPWGRGTGGGIEFMDGVAVRGEGFLPAPCPGIARGNHGCGFYAQHGAKIPHEDEVVAVVDMYGQVELGPKGLRSSRARIVAMVRPSGSGVVANLIAACRKDLAAFAARLDVHQTLKPNPPPLPVLSWWDGLFEGRVADHAALVAEVGATRAEAMLKWENAESDLTQRIAVRSGQLAHSYEFCDAFDVETVALYPSVAVFDSLVEMLAEFPVPPLDHLFAEPNRPEEN